MDLLLIENLRAVTEPIDRILGCFRSIIYSMFRLSSSGLLKMLVTTIMENEYLLVSLSLVIIGFVIGILGRLIRN